jgi:hypothetical protein
MAEQRRFRFKIIVSEDETEDVLDSLQGVLNSLKTRRTLNDITIEEVTAADDPTRLPGPQDAVGSFANHSA